MVPHQWFAWLHKQRYTYTKRETDKYNTHCNQIKTFADANQFNDAENLFNEIPNDMHGRQTQMLTQTQT